MEDEKKETRMRNCGLSLALQRCDLIISLSYPLLVTSRPVTHLTRPSDFLSPCFNVLQCICLAYVRYLCFSGLLHTCENVNETPIFTRLPVNLQSTSNQHPKARPTSLPIKWNRLILTLPQLELFDNWCAMHFRLCGIIENGF